MPYLYNQPFIPAIYYNHVKQANILLLKIGNPDQHLHRDHKLDLGMHTAKTKGI